MKYNKLGQTKLSVSELCLGTMTFGEQNTEIEAHEQLDYSLDHGINFIDTAEIYAVPCKKETYGKTEAYIGSWIKKRSKREDFVLATKVGGPSDYLAGYIRKDLGFGKRAMKEALEGSLTRLNTDYIDLYQLHWPERNVNVFGKRGYSHDEKEKWEDNFSEVIHTLETYKKEGKIRYYGLSNETPWGTMRHLNVCDRLGVNRPLTIQNPYSLLNRTYEIGMAEVSMRENIGLISYSPLAMGLLTGKYHDNKDDEASRLNKYKKQQTRYQGEESYIATTEYLKLAKGFGVTLTNLTLGFIRTRPFMTSTIFGATTMAQLKENIASKDFEFTPEMEKGINEIHERIPNPAP